MSFLDRMKDALDKGVTASKDVFGKTKEKAKDLSERGALKLSIMKLEKKAEKRFTLIGTSVYEILIKKGKNTVSKSTPEIKKLLQEVVDIEKSIDEKEEALKNVGS